jgi:hypothetical protein
MRRSLIIDRLNSLWLLLFFERAENAIHRLGGASAVGPNAELARAPEFEFETGVPRLDARDLLLQ